MAKLNAAAKLNNRACELMDEGRFEEARRTFERAEKAGSTSVNRLMCLMRLGALDDALDAFERSSGALLGHSDHAACKLIALLCARGMPIAAARLGLTLLATRAAYSDDRSRGELGMMAIVASALAGDAMGVGWRNTHAERLGRLKTLLRARGRRSVFLVHILKPDFWQWEETPDLATKLKDDRTRWEWRALVALRARLAGARPTSRRSRASRTPGTTPSRRFSSMRRLHVARVGGRERSVVAAAPDRADRLM